MNFLIYCVAGRQFRTGLRQMLHLNSPPSLNEVKWMNPNEFVETMFKGLHIQLSSDNRHRYLLDSDSRKCLKGINSCKIILFGKWISLVRHMLLFSYEMKIFANEKIFGGIAQQVLYLTKSRRKLLQYFAFIHFAI